MTLTLVAGMSQEDGPVYRLILPTGDLAGGLGFFRSLTHLLVDVLAVDDRELPPDWVVYGRPVGEDSLTISLRRDGKLGCKWIRLAVPKLNLDMTYVVGALLARLLVFGLAFPTTELGAQELKIGDLDTWGSTGREAGVCPPPIRG